MLLKEHELKQSKHVPDPPGKRITSTFGNVNSMKQQTFDSNGDKVSSMKTPVFFTQVYSEGRNSLEREEDTHLNNVEFAKTL